MMDGAVDFISNEGRIGHARTDFRGSNHRGSFHHNDDSGFRSDYHHVQRALQFNEHNGNALRQDSNGASMHSNKNDFNRQYDQQGFGSRI